MVIAGGLTIYRRARSNTSRSIGAVSLPVGRVLLARVVRANQQRSIRRCSVLAVVPKNKCGAAADDPPIPKDRKIHVESDLPIAPPPAARTADRVRASGRAGSSAPPQASGLLSGGAHPDRGGCIRPSVAGRHRDVVLVGWEAKPVSQSARKRKSPERSPVNIRPVRLPPWAAGARPTTRTSACGSPSGGTGRPIKISSRNARRFTRATFSQYSRATAGNVRRRRPPQPGIASARVFAKSKVYQRRLPELSVQVGQ